MEGQRYEISEEEWHDIVESHRYHINDLRPQMGNIYEQICAVFYSILFLSGLICNSYVLYILITIVRYRLKSSNSNNNTNANNVNTSLLIYLISLCIVDIFVLSALSLTISDVGSGGWKLPASFCSIYWIAEIMNKIMTSMISASLSLSCYFSVCRFNVTQMYKSSFVAALILAIGLSMTCWQAVLAFTYADSFYIVYGFENDTINIGSRKCVFHPDDDYDAIEFTISTISCGYVLPVLIMLVCYAAIVKKIFYQSRLANGRASTRFRRTLISVATLTLFYFCTWTPYWVVVITLSVLSQDTTGQNNLSPIAIFVHVFPFLNSAFAPLVYTLFNRNIRSQYKSIRKNISARKNTTTIDNRSAIPLVMSENVITDRHEIPQASTSDRIGRKEGKFSNRKKTRENV